MVPLNLPITKLDISRKKDVLYVWCPIRKKKLVLTPEEWVRQHFIAYLIENVGISKGKIASEYSLQYNSMNRRADIVVLNDNGKPLILVECKAPNVLLVESVFFQIAQYQNSIPAKILILTNGINHCMLTLQADGHSFTSDLSTLKELVHQI